MHSLRPCDELLKRSSGSNRAGLRAPGAMQTGCTHAGRIGSLSDRSMYKVFK